MLADEMELDENRVVELANEELEPVLDEDGDAIGVVVDEDEFVNLAMLLVKLKLLEALVPAAALVFIEADILVVTLEEVLR
jgi:hypothetical protein